MNPVDKVVPQAIKSANVKGTVNAIAKATGTKPENIYKIVTEETRKVVKSILNGNFSEVMNKVNTLEKQISNVQSDLMVQGREALKLKEEIPKLKNELERLSVRLDNERRAREKAIKALEEEVKKKNRIVQTLKKLTKVIENKIITAKELLPELAAKAKENGGKFTKSYLKNVAIVAVAVAIASVLIKFLKSKKTSESVADLYAGYLVLESEIALAKVKLNESVNYEDFDLDF